MSIEFLKASFGITSLNTLSGLVKSRDSATLSTQKRNRCASTGSEMGHVTGVLESRAISGWGDGMSESQIADMGSSRLEAGLVCLCRCGGICHEFRLSRCAVCGSKIRLFLAEPLLIRSPCSIVCAFFRASDPRVLCDMLDWVRCLVGFLPAVIPEPSESSVTTVDSSTKSTTKRAR